MSGHVVNKCRSSLSCAKCSCKHHSSICRSTSGNNNLEKKVPETSSKGAQTEGAHNLLCNAATSVLVLTARGKVCNASEGKSAYIRIIFDNCSTKSYITDFFYISLYIK